MLVGRYGPTKVIRVRNKDKPWFDYQCRHAFGLERKAHLRWTRDRSRVNWEQFARYQVRANGMYLGAKRQFSDKKLDALMNVQSLISGGPLLSRSSSSTQSTLVGSSSSLPPLVSEGGRLMYESVGEADLLSDHCHNKH